MFAVSIKNFILLSLSGSEGIAALLAAKIIGVTVQSHGDGLPARHEFFTNGILFQGIIAVRHLTTRLRSRARDRRRFSPPGGNQPVSDIDEDSNDDYA
jgi:hypothetical protein